MTRSHPAGIGDFHSHLVPGVDDGAQSIADTLDGVRRMVDAGVGRIITTPHLDGSLTLDPTAFDARMGELDAAWERARRAVASDFPELDFRRGHEILLDRPDVDLADPRLRLGGTSFALVEWPRLQVPPGTAAVVARLRSAGWRPVIAHPERYGGMDVPLALPGEWRRAGAFLQVNHGSLLGRYGPEARRQAVVLLARGWVDYLASDFHGRAHLDLFIEAARELFREAGGMEQWRLLTSVNPSRLFSDEEPIPVPALTVEEGLLKKLRKMLRGARS